MNVGVTRRNFRQYDRDLGQAGLVVPQLLSAASVASSALVANRAYYVRFVPSRTMLIDRIAFVLTAASGTDDPCDAGIYSSALARLTSAGATTGKLNASNNTVQTATFTAVTLTAGTVYYAAFAANSTASVLHTSVVTGSYFDLFGTTTGVRGAGTQATAYPLVDPGSITGTSNVPILAVRES